MRRLPAYLRLVWSATFVWTVSLSTLVTAADAPLTFERDVRPLLKSHCFHCHGEEDKPESGLDLRLVRFMARGGESGPAVVAGQRAQSLLWQKLASGEMPPGEAKLTPAQREIIGRWIDQGAHTKHPEPESLDQDGFTAEERSHWSFQSIARPEPPAVPNSVPVRTPVDRFLGERLQRDGLSFSPEADRATLIRRLTFDLWGLPPEPEAVAAFVADPRPDAYERLVDTLLASPRYGERWARHWLDAAGYADSDGYGDKDLERKYVHKYRDYVVRALNADRPWDALIREQLAGDELLAPGFKNLSPSDADKLIATGFLRMAPDGTGDPAADQNVARNDCVAETIKIVTTSLLGLSVGCAQCHAHRYDPITQVDYYRLRAVFEPALDWKTWRPPQARLVSLWTDETRALATATDAEVKRLEQARLAEHETLAEQVREKGMEGLDEPLKQQLREAFKTPVAKRTAEQKALLVKYPKANIPVATFLERNAPKEYKAIVDKYAPQIAEAQKRRPQDDFAHCLTEIPGKASPTFLFFRGDFNQPKQEIAPGELTVLCSTSGAQDASAPIPTDDPQVPTTGRRLAYAKHLTNGRHPLVARVMVNRLWHHHFGRGIVASVTDFGVLGERPTHPELLDWLAAEFMRSGWRWKPLHRLMVTSHAYRQTSVRREDLDTVDPENRLLGRMSLRRLEAEAVRDAILSVSGRLCDKMFGPPVPVSPDTSGQIVIAVDTRDGAGRPTGKVVPLGEDEFRRSLYLQVRRSMPLGILETFDAPVMSPNCGARTSSTVAPQALMLLNNEFIWTESEHLARRVQRELPKDPEAQLRRAWRLALSVEPSAAQLAAAQAFLKDQTATFDAAPASAKPAGSTSAERALACWCHALLCSNAFLYVD